MNGDLVHIGSGRQLWIMPRLPRIPGQQYQRSRMVAGPSVHHNGVMIQVRSGVNTGFQSSTTDSCIVILHLQIMVEQNAIQDDQIMWFVSRYHVWGEVFERPDRYQLKTRERPVDH